jgi:hypothetical protein
MCRDLAATLLSEVQQASRDPNRCEVLVMNDPSAPIQDEWISWSELERRCADLDSAGGVIRVPFAVFPQEPQTLHELEPLSVRFDRDALIVHVDIAAPRSCRESNPWWVPDLDEVIGRISRRLALDDPSAIASVEIVLVQ